MNQSKTDLQVLIQVDGICEQFEQAYRQGKSPQLEKYLELIAPEHRSRLVDDLVALDVGLRMSDYKHRLVDQFVEMYSPQLNTEHSIESLRSIIERAVESNASERHAADKKTDGTAQQDMDTSRQSTSIHADTDEHDLSFDLHATESFAPNLKRVDPSLPQIEGYDVVDTLGAGGMGVVYKARERALDRIVALKMILRSDSIHDEHLKRFQREAKAIAELNDPRFVQIYAFGQHRGLPYMALEFVEGGSLEAYRRGEPQSERFAAETIEVICRAMAKAHASGLVHRDLKPHNILLTADLQPKVADFGLVKRQHDQDSQQTEYGRVMGTACYMSPEQSRGELDVGPATDIHAIGGILYCLLTGRPPFLGKTMHDTLQQVRNEEALAPSRLRAGLSKDLETICLKCLEKDSTRRYATATEVAEECQRFLTGRPIVARPVGAIERGWRWARRNPLGATTAALIGLIAVVSSVMSWRLLALDQKKTQAEIATGEVLNESMEVFHLFFFATDNVLRSDRKNLKFRQKLFQEVLEKIDKIPATPLDTAMRYRDKAIAHQRLGDIALEVGGTDRAQHLFDLAYDDLKKAEKIEPERNVSLRNLSAVCKLQAKTCRALGQTIEGRDKVKEALEYAERWHALPKSDTERLIDSLKAIEEAQTLLGDYELTLGNIAAAEKAFTAARETLAKCEAQSELDDQARFDIALRSAALALWLGKTHHRMGEPDQAESDYQSAVTQYNRLWQQTKSDDALFPLSRSLLEQGDFYLSSQKNLLAAEESYARAYSQIVDLFKRYTDSLQARRAVANINYRLATLVQLASDQKVKLTKVPNNSDAKELIGKSVYARQQEVDADPSNMQAKIELAIALARQGAHADAAKLAEELVDAGVRNPRLLSQACATFALCSQSSDVELQKVWRTRALETLDLLLEAGWKDAITLREDPDLAAIQQLPDFQAKLARITP